MLRFSVVYTFVINITRFHPPRVIFKADSFCLNISQKDAFHIRSNGLFFLSYPCKQVLSTSTTGILFSRSGPMCVWDVGPAGNASVGGNPGDWLPVTSDQSTLPGHNTLSELC